MKVFKIVTTRIVESVISQEFWVEADDQNSAVQKLQDSGFSGYDSNHDGIEEGDEDRDFGDEETVSIDICSIEEEEETEQ